MKKHELLRTYREYRGVTQKEVAKKLNMTHSGYSKYERGERKITIDIWVELMRILQIPSSALGNDEDYIVQSYEMDYEIRLYDLAKDIIANKDNMSQLEKASAAKIFKNQFDKIQEEKRILLENIKFDDFNQTIKWLKLDFLFKE